jgi:hypothetical protein
MRIIASKPNRNDGNVIVIALFIAFILGLALASYLKLVDNRSRGVARSQLWNESMVVTEAGIEDALGFINKFVNISSQKITDWTSAYAVDNWQNSGNVYWVTRYLDDTKTRYYTVYITNVATGPIIRSTGYVPAPAWLSGGQPISRTVMIGTKTDSYFNAAMAALGTINLKGNNIATDSFDSSATNYPGYWTNTIRSANGDVVTDSVITNSTLNVGNANVAGHIKTGPGGILAYNANCSVGDLPWVDSFTPGIKPGWYTDDMNVLFKDVKIPNVTWWNAAGAGTGGPGTVNSKYYDHVFTSAASGGYYTLSDSGNIYVGTNVTVTIKVPQTVGTFAPNYLYVAGTGASSGKFVAYIDCANVTLGTDDKPQSGLAGNMAFLGTPNCTSLSYKGNGDFTGVMYMPQADFQLAGGGSGIVDFIGSSVTRTVQMNGHYHFHFDEALRKWSPDGAYIAALWVEL